MDDFLNTGKSATEIAIEVCNKLHIDYSLGAGGATLNGVPVRPADVKALFPPSTENE